MATQTFKDAIKANQDMTVIKADGTEIDGFYCDPKVDRNTLPTGWYAYDIRYDDDGCGIFVELCHDYVVVNSAGTFLTQTMIPELTNPASSVEFAIDEEEWNMAHWDGDDDYDENATYNGPACPDRNDADWDFTF